MVSYTIFTPFVCRCLRKKYGVDKKYLPPDKLFMFSYCSFIPFLVPVFSADAIFLVLQWWVHECAMLVQVIVYMLESGQKFLMDFLWIQVLEELWVESFCEICNR